MRYHRQNPYLKRQKPYRPISGVLSLLALAGLFVAQENGTMFAALNPGAIEAKSSVIVTRPRKYRSTANKRRIIKGHAKVVDGDTIKINGRRIRLFGIDAPESRQSCKKSNGRTYRCGAVATVSLRNFIRRSQPIKCYQKSKDRYGRSVADCYRADGASLASSLVAAGLALDWPKYSGGKYAMYQLQARTGNYGIWAGKFERPWDYRARR